MFADTIEIIGLKPLTDLLALFGNWPMTQNTWDEATFDWKTATVAGRQLYGTNYFLSVFNYLDSENTDQSTIYVKLPRFRFISFFFMKRNLSIKLDWSKFAGFASFYPG